MSAYYIDDDQSVHTYQCVSGMKETIQLDNGKRIENPNCRRLFAVHPSQSQFCRLIHGIWHYKGEPIDKSKRLDERAWVDGHGLIMVPDTRLPPQPSYTYRPMRGYSGSMAVEDGSGEVIGWVAIDDLGYTSKQTVRDWMRDTNYVIQGDGWEN
jgi:hypothetical protein